MSLDQPLGRIVVLNGVPRSGKSSIVAAIQERFDGDTSQLDPVGCADAISELVDDGPPPGAFTKLSAMDVPRTPS
jgi:Chloramphenicol phosphotransferase-like protein